MRTYWLLGKESQTWESGESQISPTFQLPTWELNPLSKNSSEEFTSALSSSNTNDSCLSLIQEYKKNAENAVWRANNYRSAPTITFSDYYTPSDCVL
ncbi:hypothetical protein X975_18095, partial [Stegodyphus mimosarum]